MLFLGLGTWFWSFFSDFSILPSAICCVVLMIAFVANSAVSIIQMVINRNITLNLQTWSNDTNSDLKAVMTRAFGQDNSTATKSYMKTFKRNLGFVISAEFLKSTGVDHHKDRIMPGIMGGIFTCPVAIFPLLAGILAPFAMAKMPEGFADSYFTIAMIVNLAWFLIVPSIFSSKKIDVKIDMWMAQNFPNQNMVYLLLYRPALAKKQQNRR